MRSVFVRFEFSTMGSLWLLSSGTDRSEVPNITTDRANCSAVLRKTLKHYLIQDGGFMGEDGGVLTQNHGGESQDSHRKTAL